MAKELPGCDCAFCSYLSLSKMDWLCGDSQINTSLFENINKRHIKKVSSTCNSNDMRVVSKTAARNHVSRVKQNETACEVALLAI